MSELIKGVVDGTRLIILPTPLVEQVKVLAANKGVSLSTYAENALKEALRAEELGTSLGETVDLYHLYEVQRGSGALHVSRTSLDQLLTGLYRDRRDELHRLWQDSGRWYGEFLYAKLGEDQTMGFLEKVLLVSWNLDETEVKRSYLMVDVRLVSFTMSVELTELMVSFIAGVMDSLGYELNNREVERGLVSLSYRKKP